MQLCLNDLFGLETKELKQGQTTQLDDNGVIHGNAPAANSPEKTEPLSFQIQEMASLQLLKSLR